jgi:hypothetical protein
MDTDDEYGAKMKKCMLCAQARLKRGDAWTLGIFKWKGKGKEVNPKVQGHWRRHHLRVMHVTLANGSRKMVVRRRDNTFLCPTCGNALKTPQGITNHTKTCGADTQCVCMPCHVNCLHPSIDWPHTNIHTHTLSHHPSPPSTTNTLTL